MSLNEISVLSDDLQPRDSPNHSLFKNFASKPIVPDLSITEVPNSRGNFLYHGHQHQPVGNQQGTHQNTAGKQKPLVEECKTYSEWRKRSAQISKTQSPHGISQDNSYVHYISGMSNPTVLDSLNSSTVFQRSDKQPLQMSIDRGGSSSRESVLNGRSEKTSPACSTSHSASSNSHSRGTVSGEERTKHLTKLPCGKSSLRSINSNGTIYQPAMGVEHFENNHVTVPNCSGCNHWPHHPFTTVSCNGVPAYHNVPHGGIPSYNTFPSNPGSKAGSAISVPSPKSRSSIPPHSCGDSVVYNNLYQIVLSQSEQLKSLQMQVERLLISQDQHRRTENRDSSASGTVRGKHINQPLTLMERGTQTSDGESNTNDHKMSIGVMTSFVHTVAYAGRVELVDSRNKGANCSNINSIPGNRKQGAHSRSTSTSPPSRALPSSLSSSGSDSQPSPRSATKNRCCKCHECVGNSSGNKDSKNKLMDDRVKDTQMDQVENAFRNKGPGVSAAIRAVRGCQEALANATSPNKGETGRSAFGVDDSITLNGVDLPTVVEQPVSPPSSIHVDMQDYHGSSSGSSEDESSAGDGDGNESSSFDSDDKPTRRQDPNRWALYQNVLGQVNQLLQDRDKGSTDDACVQDCCNGKSKVRKERNGLPKTRSSSDSAQGNFVPKRVAFQHEPKSKEDSTADNIKQLALKYLRENYPEELALSEGHAGSKPTASHKRVQDMALYSMGNNMSFATFRYLERYNLLPENFKMNRIEELPGYIEEITDDVDNGVLTNGASYRSPPGNFRDSRRVHQVNMGQWNVPSNGRGNKPREHALQHHLPPSSKEKNKKAFFDEPTGSHKKSPKTRHKRPFPQLNTAPTSTMPSGQQTAPTCKILDITALRQQPKLL